MLRSLILMLFAFVSLPAMAAETSSEKERSYCSWVEYQVISRNPSRIYGWCQKDELVGPVGMFLFAEKESDGYWQVFGGPTWKLTKELLVGVGIGRETMSDEFQNGVRKAFYLVFDGKVEVEAIFEWGPSGPWEKITAAYPIGRLGVGAMHETGLGNGPRVEYNFKKVQAWGALLRDKDTTENTLVLGINVSF